MGVAWDSCHLHLLCWNNYHKLPFSLSKVSCWNINYVVILWSGKEWRQWSLQLTCESGVFLFIAVWPWTVIFPGFTFLISKMGGITATISKAVLRITWGDVCEGLRMRGAHVKYLGRTGSICSVCVSLIPSGVQAMKIGLFSIPQSNFWLGPSFFFFLRLATFNSLWASAWVLALPARSYATWVGCFVTPHSVSSSASLAD